MINYIVPSYSLTLQVLKWKCLAFKMSVELVTFPNGRVKLINENYVFVKQTELSGGKIS